MASTREQLHTRLTEWIQTWAAGDVRADIRPRMDGSGKSRNISFGLTGSKNTAALDAVLTIWSERLLVMQSNRGDHTFANEQEFVNHCVSWYGAPVPEQRTGADTI